MLISLLTANFPIFSKSEGCKSTFVAIDAVPALPGATKSLDNNLLCNSFQAIACSLPPEPINSHLIADYNGIIFVYLPISV
jgi:hypothetical protein